MAHSSLRYALFWQTPVYQSYGSFLYVALRLYIHEDEKSPGSLTYQDQQTGASNFVNIDFLELFHIFLSTWNSMAYLIQNAENQRFKSPLLSYQSILHLYLPTKISELKKPGNSWCRRLLAYGIYTVLLLSLFVFINVNSLEKHSYIIK